MSRLRMSLSLIDPTFDELKIRWVSQRPTGILPQKYLLRIPPKGFNLFPHQMKFQSELYSRNYRTGLKSDPMKLNNSMKAKLEKLFEFFFDRERKNFVTSIRFE